MVRFSSIGDIVLTTPVVRALHRAGYAVHFLTKRGFAPVLSNNPYLERVWTIDRRLEEVLDSLRKEEFYAIVDLHNNLRSWRLSLLLRQSKCYRFRKLNLQKWLLTRLGIDRMPNLHVVDRYLAAAAPLGAKPDGEGLDFFSGILTSEVARSKLEARWPQSLTPAFPATGWPGYLAFVIGAAHATKCLTEAQITDFCRRYPGPIVLLGGPAERELGERVARAAGPRTVNACGHFALTESAELIRRARAVLTHDTGLMHVAAAFGKPIVSVWGNTVPALGMYPYLPGQEAEERDRRVEVLGLACRPCSKIGHPACPKGHFKCIKMIETERLLAAVDKL